jgi:hypothetical protein
MHTVRRVLMVVLTVGLVPTGAFAQASITGTVKDTSGAVLPGVTVEAVSDVLIEKARSAVTDGSGRFQIIDLRPGAYVLTFTLSGFNTVRRDGVTLTGSSVVTVDTEMRVGAVEETVTVTGEAPIVDVQSTTRQSVLNAEVIDALPTSRNFVTLARMVPATLGGGNDVGGSLLADVGAAVTIHGSSVFDQRITLNGISVMTLQAGGGLGGQQPDVGSASEVAVDTSSFSADLPTGGVRINFIPRDGGNTFRNATFFTFSNSGLQGSNFTDELRRAGLGAAQEINYNYDLNESFGGPFKRDRVWYWFSSRYNKVENYVPVFENRNAFDPTKWTYDPDTGRRGVTKGTTLNTSLRLTWQATLRNKIAATYKADTWCNCPFDVSATRTPEAGYDRRFPRLRQEHVEWTSPVTNRLLLEAVGMHLYERWGNMHLRVNGGSLDDPAHEAALAQMIPVIEQSTGLNYRAYNNTPFIMNNTAVPNWAYRGAMAYVTGAHAVKVGVNRTHGYLDVLNYTQTPYHYQFNNGIPNQITLRGTPFGTRTHLDNDLGLFVQDRWTLGRVTLNGALRYDYFGASFPEQTVGPSVLTPGRSRTFPAQDNLSWHDVTYRSGAAYDVFGTGRTAIKVAFNKYLLGQTLNGLASAPNPINTLVTTANRAWTDQNGNFRPDCDLTNPVLQDLRSGGGDFCGPTFPSNFGSLNPSAAYDADLLTGWGHRQANWEFSAGVQHEVLPRVSVDVGYFRRAWKNFQVTDNLSVGPADYDTFSMTLPADPRLPNGGGYRLDGLVAIREQAFTRPVQNYNALSGKFGEQTEVFNGVDVTVNARLQNGLTFQAGTSTGKTTEDNCEIVAQLPELLNAPLGLFGPAAWRPAQFCRRESPFLTNFKGYGVYTIPKVGVQVAGTFRSTPGAAVNAIFNASNAYLAANSTLGRALAGGVANLSIALVEPNTMFLDRRNELDLRFGKVLRVGRHRSIVSVDLFNATNSNAVLTANQNFGAWLAPTAILNPRVVKVTVQYDF